MYIKNSTFLQKWSYNLSHVTYQIHNQAGKLSWEKQNMGEDDVE
jgi:hypothetical protein